MTGNNYLTFDGKEFSMESGCDFILMKDEAQSSASTGDRFLVTIGDGNPVTF